MHFLNIVRGLSVTCQQTTDANRSIAIYRAILWFTIQSILIYLHRVSVKSVSRLNTMNSKHEKSELRFPSQHANNCCCFWCCHRNVQKFNWKIMNEKKLSLRMRNHVIKIFHKIQWILVAVHSRNFLLLWQFIRCSRSAQLIQAITWLYNRKILNRKVSCERLWNKCNHFQLSE